MNPDLEPGALAKPPLGEFLAERKGNSRYRRGDFWVGRKHSPESLEKMRQSAVAARASGSHDSLKKPVVRLSTCLHCGGEFTRKSRNRILGRKFCSAACQHRNERAKADERAATRIRKCRRCGNAFTPSWKGRAWGKFCSTVCRQTLAIAVVSCAECGGSVTRLAADAKRRTNHFCSRSCMYKFGKGANSPMFRPESILDPKRRAQSGEWKRISAEVRARDGHCCKRCGEAWSGSRAFPVDHIIPWRVFRDKSQANDKDNLVTLCPGCHGWKTSTAERLWLKGDVIAFEQFRKSIGMPSQVKCN